MTTKHMTILGGMSALLAGSAIAQNLGKYSFTGATDGDDGTASGFAVENLAANVSFSALANTGLTGIGVMSAFAAPTESPNSNNGAPPYPFDGKGFEATYPNIRVTSDPDASNDYLEFNVTPTDWNSAVSGLVVPEPGSLMLLGLGGVLLLVRRRR